jgi:hypothetical protein
MSAIDTNFDKFLDELSTTRQQLMQDLKNDKECLKENIIYSKLACIDSIMKSSLKYRNIKIKEKRKIDL